MAKDISGSSENIDLEIEKDLKRIIEKKRQEKKALIKLLDFIEKRSESDKKDFK